MENSFNLVDEPWIPIADVGRVSLKDVFSQPNYRALGGNAVQKIALMKLLLAICQAAVSLPDNETWENLGEKSLSQACLGYLRKWHDRFYLFGNTPFLQLPAISTAALQSYGAVLPEVATGNTTVLSQFQQEKALDDSDKALLLIVLMAFALGGKKADNSVVLCKGYMQKLKTAKPGPAMAFMGLLHSYTVGESLQQSLWLNLLTDADVQSSNMFPRGMGTAPWESMPASEDCSVAKALKQSLMGRLVPLSRFCLLQKEGLHYSEGIAHPNYQDGVVDPTVAVDMSHTKIKVLWTDPEKRPWRQLPALLSFIKQGSGNFDCLQLRSSLPRARHSQESVAVWSGGLRVSSNAGEQYASGSNDFVESEVWLHSTFIDKFWFTRLQQEMKELEDVSKKIYSTIRAYYNEQKASGDSLAGQGTNMFWQLSERNFQELVNACDQKIASQKEVYTLRRSFVSMALNTYDHFCPNSTARQLDSWAKCRPNFAQYLKKEKA